MSVAAGVLVIWCGIVVKEFHDFSLIPKLAASE